MSESSLSQLTQLHKLDQDHARERNQKRKWALGEAVPTRGHPIPRPSKPYNAAYAAVRKREVEFQKNKAAQGLRLSRKYDYCAEADLISDSSAEEDVKDASTAPEPDAAYTYSYDAPTGPSKGSTILGQALAKAVEKFETKETEKLIKNEYEVVAQDREEVNAGYTADEDDFELV